MAIQRNSFLEFLFLSYVFNGFCDGEVRIVGDEEINCDGTKFLTLTCESDEHQSARYWYFNRIGNHDNLKRVISVESPHYTAVGSNTLSVNSFNQDDVGVYQCDDGTYLSNKLTVKCSCEIEIKAQRTQYVARRGSEVTLKFRIVDRRNNDQVVHLSEWTKKNKNTASIIWKRSDNVHFIITYTEGKRSVRNIPDQPYTLTSEDHFELHAVQRGIDDGITSCILDVSSKCVSKRIDYQLTVIGEYEVVSVGSTALYVVIPSLAVVIIIIIIAIIGCVVFHRWKNTKVKKKERQDENEYMDIDDVVGDYLELRAGETSEYENMQELNTIHSNTHVRGIERHEDQKEGAGIDNKEYDDTYLTPRKEGPYEKLQSREHQYASLKPNA